MLLLLTMNTGRVDTDHITWLFRACVQLTIEITMKKRSKFRLMPSLFDLN